MRRLSVSVLVLAMACGKSGSDPTPAAEKDAERSGPAKASAEASPTEAPTPDGQESDPPEVEVVPESPAEPEISSTRALILSDGKLLRLAPSGKTEPMAEAPGMTDCDVDDAHRVVWLVSSTAIAAFDPADREVHPVAKGFASPPGEYGDLAWRVQRKEGSSPYGQPTAGRADGLDDCVALVLTVGPEPRVGGEIVAEGDREWYCFADDADVGADPEDQTLDAEQAPIKAGYDRAELVDAALLARLDVRHREHGHYTRPPLAAPEPPAPTVDRAQCEEDPESCGTAEYVGGGRLWRVVTSNSRGDFYHEGHHIYDTKTSSWWDPATGKHTPQPAPDGESAIAPSPDGTWGLHGDTILSLAEAKAVGRFDGTMCGWE